MTDPAAHSQIVAWAVNAAMALTVLGLIFAFVRLFRGPSLPDRVVSIDLITVLTVAIVGLLAITYTEPDFLDIAVVLALVAFLATIAFAWYAERTNELRHRDKAAADGMEETDGR